MSRRSHFRFKQFSISDEGCAMKLGTDAVLLGAWVNPEKKTSILDIGCGCGILTLMMAQRSSARVTGVEIHSPSAQAARENAKNSPWKERIHIEEMDFQHFILGSHNKFDLIIPNPPYFVNSLKPPDEGRHLSRHSGILNQDILSEGVQELLTDQGTFALILPFGQEKGMIKNAYIKSLFADSILHIRSKPMFPVIRSCISFTRYPSELQINELHIRDSEGNFSSEYKELTRDFYL